MPQRNDIRSRGEWMGWDSSANSELAQHELLAKGRGCNGFEIEKQTFRELHCDHGDSLPEADSTSVSVRSEF